MTPCTDTLRMVSNHIKMRTMVKEDKGENEAARALSDIMTDIDDGYLSDKPIRNEADIRQAALVEALEAVNTVDIPSFEDNDASYCQGHVHAHRQRWEAIRNLMERGVMATIKTELERRLFEALKRISQYHSPEYLRRNSERDYGCAPVDAIEMSYENVLVEAKAAIRGVRRQRVKP